MSFRIVKLAVVPVFFFDKPTCRSFRQFSKSWVVNLAETDVVLSVAAIAKVGATAAAALAAVCVQDAAPDGTTAAQGTVVASRTGVAMAGAEIVVQDTTTLSLMPAPPLRTPTLTSSPPPSTMLSQATGLDSAAICTRAAIGCDQ
jgi:hypothetical protein